MHIGLLTNKDETTRVLVGEAHPGMVILSLVARYGLFRGSDTVPMPLYRKDGMFHRYRLGLRPGETDCVYRAHWLGTPSARPQVQVKLRERLPEYGGIPILCTQIEDGPIWELELSFRPTETDDFPCLRFERGEVI
jgi:hypothetical protein